MGRKRRKERMTRNWIGSELNLVGHIELQTPTPPTSTVTYPCAISPLKLDLDHGGFIAGLIMLVNWCICSLLSIDDDPYNVIT